MRFRRTMSVIIAAAMLTSTFCAFSASAAETDNASTANSVDSIVLNDFTTYPTYSGNDLGSTYSPKSTTFKVWAPSSSKVTLNLYKSGDVADKTKISATEMKLDKSTGVWSVTVNGDIKNTYYTYEVVNENNPNGIEVCDIYAKAAGVNGNRAMVVDLDSTDPEGWDKDNFQRVSAATDASVWEVHIKDFSYDPESGVSQANRGKYMAFTELQTTLNNAGDVKTCMNYLKDLGIKYVQINPMYDFGSVDEAGDSTQFNWGYDPKNYNVPEGSYSSNPNDGNVRINEMKQMIKALHDNGIGVIMDVVYNHTYSSKDSWFNLTVPNYYYRQTMYQMGDVNSDSSVMSDDALSILRNSVKLDTFTADQLAKADVDGDGAITSADALKALRISVKLENPVYKAGDWSNGSGCGNDTASEREMFKKFMVESVTYWANEYHIDGFRFDLMGLHDVDTMNAVRAELDKIDTKIITYGEGWNLGTNADKIDWAGNKTLLCTQGKASVVSDRVGFFNDSIRDALKGKAYDDLVSRGFVSGTGSFASSIYTGTSGQKSGAWSAAAPTQNVVYACCHDNQTLWDRLVASEYGTNASNELYLERNEQFVASNKLSGAIVLTSQGIPFMLAGEEFSRTKLGDHNSYKSAADLNMLDWSRAEEYADVVSYYKGMMQIRYNFDAFSDGTSASGNAMTKLTTPSGVVGYSIPNLSSAKNQWSSAVVYFNGNLTNSAEVTLPTNGEYVVIADDQTAGLSAIETVSGGKATVQPTSALILIPKESYDKVGLSDKEDSLVVVNHIDNSTGNVLKKVTIKGSEGQKYSTQQANDLSLEYDLDTEKLPENATGRMTKGATEVNYYYNVYPGGISTVTVKYVDEDGNSIAGDTVLRKQRNGTAYETKPANIKNYELVKTPENANGVYAEGGVEVVYIYKKNAAQRTDALVESTVHVKINNGSFTPYFYFWDDVEKESMETAKGWPGTKLTEKDSDGWYTFTFKNHTVYNWILNDNSGKQTSDMTGTGDIWVVADGSADNVTVSSKNPEK